jgi:hypothetical protein
MRAHIFSLTFVFFLTRSFTDYLSVRTFVSVTLDLMYLLTRLDKESG